MPSYDYFCPDNGQVVEVLHPMSAQLQTWSQVCQAVEMDLGETPADASVERLVTAGIPIASSQLPPGSPSPCGPPRQGCCGMCPNV